MGELIVLDYGRSTVHFGRMVVERCACCPGFDLYEPMIRKAEELETEQDSYGVADAQDLGFIEDRSNWRNTRS